MSDVATVVAGAADLDAGVNVRLHGDPRASLPLDEASLQAVLKILVDNAGEHGAGTLDIHVAAHGDETVICVTDDGHGIAPGDAARIFEPFFTTRREEGGTGLGLAIAKALLANADGTIEYLPPPRIRNRCGEYRCPVSDLFSPSVTEVLVDFAFEGFAAP